jgi:glycosyltransferase involved in cell wall biosynthesis
MPRIALFSDSCHETGSVARTALAIETCAKRRSIPLLSVRTGPETRLVHDGSITRLDLKRSSLLSVGRGRDARFDLSMWRHIGRVAETAGWFAPDVLHFAGPSDVGQLGAFIGHRLGIPMVASCHTDPRDCAERRRRLLMRFYRVARVVLAPTREVAQVLETGTGRPTVAMSRNVNIDLFTPARRRGPNAIVNIGYVGRLAEERNVRLLHAVESALDAEGLDARFTIVGDGDGRQWLRQHLLRAEFTGVLRGEALADAYAQMDVLAYPSEVNTESSVVLEAMASGVPVVVMSSGGQRFVVDAGRSGIVADDGGTFVRAVRTLVKNRQRREAMGVAARARAVDLLSSERIFVDVCSAYHAAMSEAEGEGRNRFALLPA